MLSDFAEYQGEKMTMTKERAISQFNKTVFKIKTESGVGQSYEYSQRP